MNSSTFEGTLDSGTSLLMFYLNLLTVAAKVVLCASCLNTESVVLVFLRLLTFSEGEGAWEVLNLMELCS